VEVNEDLRAKLDQIAKLPSAARAGIMGALVLLLAGGYFFLVYQDASENLAVMRAQEMELERKLSEVRSIAANIGEFEEEIGVLEVKLQKVLRQLPDDKELEVVLSDISNVGKSSGIEIKSFQRRDEVVHGFYAEVPISLEIEGEYHSVGLFFDMLARLPRIVNMGAVEMKVARESSEGTVLKVSGTATTFRFVGKRKSA
jgi:type IV pilus assembly protein PilO